MKNNKDVDSLSHTTWRCQYHVVFAPKYRRMVIYGQIKKRYWTDTSQTMRAEGYWNNWSRSLPGSYPYADKFFAEIQHFLRYGISQGKEQPIFDRHANLKYKYGNRHFWARGYFVDTVGKNKQRIQEYIKRQLEQDQIADQLSLKEFTDPFTGSKGTKA